MTTQEPWVGAADVATHLGVNKDSVYRWIDKKGLARPSCGAAFSVQTVRNRWLGS